MDVCSIHMPVTAAYAYHIQTAIVCALVTCGPSSAYITAVTAFLGPPRSRSVVIVVGITSVTATIIVIVFTIIVIIIASIDTTTAAAIAMLILVVILVTFISLAFFVILAMSVDSANMVFKETICSSHHIHHLRPFHPGYLSCIMSVFISAGRTLVLVDVVVILLVLSMPAILSVRAFHHVHDFPPCRVSIVPGFLLIPVVFKASLVLFIVASDPKAINRHLKTF